MVPLKITPTRKTAKESHTDRCRRFLGPHRRNACRAAIVSEPERHAAWRQRRKYLQLRLLIQSCVSIYDELKTAASTQGELLSHDRPVEQPTMANTLRLVSGAAPWCSLSALSPETPNHGRRSRLPHGAGKSHHSE